MDEKREIAGRLKEFGQRLCGDGHGWQKKFADMLGVAPAQMSNLLSGRAPVGGSFLYRLKELGCDTEWLTTGKASRQDSDKTVIQFGMQGYLSKEDAAKFKTLAERLSEIKKDDPDAVDKIIEMVDIMFRKK